MIVGLDIGGANLKLATADGDCQSVAFPLWKQPDQLAGTLRELLGKWPRPECVAVTMTGELADCYRTKAEGVRRILEAIQTACAGIPCQVWQTTGRFVEPDQACENFLLTAASNWQALATWAGLEAGVTSGLLLDMGSTTTDIIPLRDGVPVATGRTDVTRMLAGELVYLGARRTPLCALLQSVPVSDQPCPLAAEFFATVHDALLMLRLVPEDPDDCETADQRAATRAEAWNRLAHQVCCDVHECSEGAAEAIARAAVNALEDRVGAAITQVWSRQLADCETVILSGSGSFLAERIVDRQPRLQAARRWNLTGQWGPQIAEAACAFAVARLAGRKS